MNARVPTESARGMRRIRRAPVGAPPGTMVVDPAARAPRISVMAYDAKTIEEHDVASVDDLRGLLERRRVTWVNVDGLGDVETIRALGALFDIHRLALEDIVHVHQRPKVEDYHSHAFIVLRMPFADMQFETEQVNIFLGKGFVLTFQEKPGDCFDPVRDRLRQSSGRIRGAGADYLAYVLMDSIIDSYFPVLESYGERVEVLEQALLTGAVEDFVPTIHRLKRDFLNIRRAVWPLRELVNALTRDSLDVVEESTKVYLRDCYDHSVQLMDMVETYREIASGLIELHLATVSNRLNEVMKTLTIIATIFIPLGFIASVYGMNFDAAASPWNMPELKWYFGYPAALLLMAIVAGWLMFFFYRRGWLGPRPWRTRGKLRARPEKGPRGAAAPARQPANSTMSNPVKRSTR